jgi:ribosomal protein L22
MAQTQTEERTQAFAHLKFARVGPRKLRRVADAIRGKTVREALILLKFSGVFAPSRSRNCCAAP